MRLFDCLDCLDCPNVVCAILSSSNMRNASSFVGTNEAINALRMAPFVLFVTASGENRIASGENPLYSAAATYWSPPSPPSLPLFFSIRIISDGISSLMITLEIIDCHVFRNTEFRATWWAKKVSGKSS